MRIELKALWLGLLAAAALGSLPASAAAKSDGHFVSPGNATATIQWSEVARSNHLLEFAFGAAGEGVVCDANTYAVFLLGETQSEATTSPTFSKCHTTGQNPGTTIIDLNGCSYIFKVAKGTVSSTEQTWRLSCPSGKVLEITHPNCTMTIPTQTAENAVTYEPSVIEGVQGITAIFGASLATQYHGGICIFLGTSQIVTLKGSLTMAAYVGGKRVHLTAT
ncbi:MAG TPA: hypothetical protein VGB06_02500 [Solirubrobacterales bacterium]|jgi:hypothetical protein